MLGMSEYQNNAIFWVELAKIQANPFQPRKEFNQAALEDLADSIRQYGVLQPLVVVRKEEETENGGMRVYYELIAGERRLRAAKIAGLKQVPVIIRKDIDNNVKLELAIIENLQREDLSPIERARAFEQLHREFGLTHAQIGKKMGKSRVYVSNTLRLLSLPEEIQQGLMDGRITEGHTRPLLMLSDKPEEQATLYKEITLKRLSVRATEKIARSIAQDKVRKQKFIRDPKIRDYEKRLSENLGTRVQIEPKETGGRITIDYFSVSDLEKILESIKKIEHEKGENMMEDFLYTQNLVRKTDASQQQNFEEGKSGLWNEASKRSFEKDFVPEETNSDTERLNTFTPLEKNEFKQDDAQFITASPSEEELGSRGKRDEYFSSPIQRDEKELRSSFENQEAESYFDPKEKESDFTSLAEEIETEDGEGRASLIGGQRENYMFHYGDENAFSDNERFSQSQVDEKASSLETFPQQQLQENHQILSERRGKDFGEENGAYPPNFYRDDRFETNRDFSPEREDYSPQDSYRGPYTERYRDFSSHNEVPFEQNDFSNQGDNGSDFDTQTYSSDEYPQKQGQQQGQQKKRGFFGRFF